MDVDRLAENVMKGMTFGQKMAFASAVAKVVNPKIGTRTPAVAVAGKARRHPQEWVRAIESLASATPKTLADTTGGFCDPRDVLSVGWPDGQIVVFNQVVPGHGFQRRICFLEKGGYLHGCMVDLNDVISHTKASIEEIVERMFPHLAGKRNAVDSQYILGMLLLLDNAYDAEVISAPNKLKRHELHAFSDWLDELAK